MAEHLQSDTEAMTAATPEVATAATPSVSSVVVLAYFAVLFALVSVSSFLHKNPTVDEPVHLTAGYAYLRWGDFRLNPEHPPLAKLWAALPLLALDLKPPRNQSAVWSRVTENLIPAPTTEVAHDFAFVDNNAETLFFFAKLQMVLLAIVLGCFLYLWTTQLFGQAAGLVALTIFALDPNILAHSQIVHTDVPFAAFFFIGTYFLWRYLQAASWPNLLGLCLFAGLAAATKYSYPVMLLIWLTLAAWKIFSADPQISLLSGTPTAANRRQKTVLAVAGFFAVLSTIYFCVWAVYGFRYNAIPGEPPRFHMEWVLPAEGSPLRAIATYAADHRLLPEAWIYGQLYVLKLLRRAAYLMGHVSPDGFLAYFPVAFAVKTPLPILMLLLASLWAIWRGGVDRRQALFLLFPATVYFAAAVASRMNIGLRHILPVYPFLYVLIGGVAVWLWRRSRRFARLALAALAVWYVASNVWIYPDYLAYFNESVGGPDNGYKILLDSNLDWGQDLKGLKLWMDRHQVKNIQLLEFGYSDAEYYGIDAVFLPGSWMVYDPPATRPAEKPQYIAASASILYSPFLVGPKAKVDFTKRLRSIKPIAKIGYSIFIYKADDVERTAR